MTSLCYSTRPCIWSTLNHIIPSTDCVCYFLCDPDRPTPVVPEVQPALTSPSSLHMEHIESNQHFTVSLLNTGAIVSIIRIPSKLKITMIRLFCSQHCDTYDMVANCNINKQGVKTKTLCYAHV